MQTLRLQEGIIYGPVNSRRLGFSLGINLLPTNYKLCTFNCLYCHYGWTKIHTSDASSCLGDLPSVEQVKEALEGWLYGNQNHIDYITFSGNGEPCLHPELDEMVEVASPRPETNTSFRQSLPSYPIQPVWITKGSNQV